MVQRYQDGPDPTSSSSNDDQFHILRVREQQCDHSLAGNVATLPLNDAGTLSDLFSNRGRQFRAHITVPGARASTRLRSIVDRVRAFQAGPIGGYNDVIAMSK